MIQISHLTFAWHDDISIFHQLTVNLSRARHGLVGPNASGKSTLLALIAGRLAPASGSIHCESKAIQDLPQDPGATASEVWNEELLRTGRRIQTDTATARDWAFMDDHWPLYAAMEQQIQTWGLADLDLDADIPLSGGTRQRLRLALTLAHEESFLLLDEPSNHLDREGRILLLHALAQHHSGCLVASHDRELLNAMDTILALTPGRPHRIQVFGGGYDFYKEQHEQQLTALEADWLQSRHELERARTEAQKVKERQEQRSAQGRRNADKGGIPRIALGGMRMNSEKTTGRLATRHEEKVSQLEATLREKAQRVPVKTELHLDWKAQRRPGDRPLLSLEGVQQAWAEQNLWPEPLHLQLMAGEHLAITGANGSGKSTLLQLILGRLEPAQGQIHRRFRAAVLLDQDLSLLPAERSLLELWEDPLYGNDAGLRRTIAARLGLKAREAATPLGQLSGGQRLRAALILLTTRVTPPDLILLDEPSNHLDLDALACLVTTLRELPASLIVVTHDPYFLEDLNIQQRFELVRAR